MIYRTPVGERKVLRVLGVDPGWAKSGLVVLERSGMVTTAVHAQVVTTAPASKKERRSIRVCNDDQRRLHALWKALAGVREQFDLHALSVEAYSPFVVAGRSAGNAAHKTYASVAAAMSFGWSIGVPVLTNLPRDLKKPLTGLAGASKADVLSHVEQTVPGFQKICLAAKIPKGKLEHVGDAAGHALLALEELSQMQYGARPEW